MRVASVQRLSLHNVEGVWLQSFLDSFDQPARLKQLIVYDFRVAGGQVVSWNGLSCFRLLEALTIVPCSMSGKVNGITLEELVCSSGCDRNCCL